MSLTLISATLLKVEYSASAGLAHLAAMTSEGDAILHLQCHNMLLFRIAATANHAVVPAVVDLLEWRHPREAAVRMMQEHGYRCDHLEIPGIVHHVHVAGGVHIDLFCESQAVVLTEVVKASAP